LFFFGIGVTTYSTIGKLITPAIAVQGTITLTPTDLYFDADEDAPAFKQLRVGLDLIKNIQIK
jgi:hypothetical protein